MKFNDLILNGDFDDTTPLDKYSFANTFDVINKGEKSYFNLCKVVKFNVEDIDDSLIYYYEICNGDTWTLISYKFFNTVKLWWLICKFNDIDNPFEEVQTGTIIKIPKDDLMNGILSIIKNS